ncbi:MAG: hypothetical protein A3E83_04360 [Gammaproteobacteria bacterium RIFCSPHIGHO2_12_FULL_41_20]|nr:MAG: hypothetical protein A3E83_04360 [Gammaproteobacteria bacterium RIFCSPHIGHO2_12_FULL_41_20]
MLAFFYDFLPVLLFFLAFKYYGIYTATIVGIVATAVQALASLLFTRKFDRKVWITFMVFVLFGGMTLYFHNPIFVKWKPTIVFWIFGAILLVTQWLGKTPLMQRMLSGAFQEKMTIPTVAWRRLNLAWALFFVLLGVINLLIAYRFDDSVWVNFKLYGITGLLLLFSVFQTIFLMKYLRSE